MISFPNAKINLGLRILDRREDGYHNLRSIFLPIQLHDILEILPTKGNTILFTSGLKIHGDERDNLCLKAHQLLQKQYGIPNVRMYLHKQIPVGSGLGGGSSDAVACLVMLNEMFKLKLLHDVLFSLAMELGSDCGFFLYNQPALVEGRGEVILPVDWPHPGLRVVILKPPTSISTAAAFKACQPGEVAHEALPEIQHWRTAILNDLEAYAFQVCPELQDFIQLLYQQGAVYAGMSGSGSAVFGLFEKEPGRLAVPDTVWQYRTGVVSHRLTAIG